MMRPSIKIVGLLGQDTIDVCNVRCFRALVQVLLGCEVRCLENVKLMCLTKGARAVFEFRERGSGR